MKLILAIDPGITSVGWGIINADTKEIVTAGVRLFNEADKSLNESRRTFRSTRRLKRRRVNRREDLKKYLTSLNLYDENYTQLNPYSCRIKGLEEKLTNQEFCCAIFNICKRRGSSIEVVGEINESDEESTKTNIANNDRLLSNGKYVCEIQKERLDQGKVRGHINNFKTSDYEKELKTILSNQNLANEEQEKIIEIIIRRRNFSDGPGSFKWQTPYGKIYNGDGSVKVNMIEKMTGKCSIFTDELRAPKLAPSAEKFNLLNDLNNLRINDEPIDLRIKQDILNEFFAKGSITPKKIAIMLGHSLEEIDGFRINKNGEQLITKAEGFKTFKKIFEGYNASEYLNNYELLDNIATVLTKTKVLEERIKEIKCLFTEPINEEMILEISNQKKFVGYHSLSLKALYLMNDELYNTQLNQMQILHVSNKFKLNKFFTSQRGKNKICADNSAILSPVALRTYRQMIKVINSARKEYGEFDSIIVESTRDRNSAEQKQRINENQRYNENKNEKVKTIVDGYNGVNLNYKLKEKILLYLEQEAKTGYIQEPINLDRLIYDSTSYEVDHIIPISVSLDDSINNKTLVSRKENQDKGNFTPLMAYDSGKFSYGNKDSYIGFVTSLYKRKMINRKKLQNYLYAKDINKYENMKDFIARNLVDTSYASRLIYNTLHAYFKDNDIDTKVFTIKGSSTNRFRKYMSIEKDRNKDFSHHAIDALLIASLKTIPEYGKVFRDFSVSGKDIIFNKETGEIVSNVNDYDLNKDSIKLIKKISEYKVNRYSHMVDTKPNRSIANQTIYSTRNYGDNDKIISKFKDIYAKKIASNYCPIADDIVNGKADTKYLMARNDKQSWEKIKEVVFSYFDNFKDAVDKDGKPYISQKNKSSKIEYTFNFNPFYELVKDNPNNYIRKYSKKGDGPKIKSIKYIDSNLGNCIDITSKYDTKNKKIVLLQVSPYRTDFYLDGDIYKFITIRYSDIKFNKKENINVIDEDWYEKQKIEKKISNKSEFKFSIHHGEIIELKDKNYCGLFLYVATKSDSKNCIELKPLDSISEKRITPTIGKNTILLNKYSCDVLGNIRKISNSRLKLKF